MALQYLPDPDEQKWLTRYLRRLIERAGWRHFVCAPLLEPTRTWFPEPWSHTVYDAHILTQRLLHYAGIAQLRPKIHGYWSVEDEEGRRYDWAAYFTGIENEHAHFGVRVETLADPEIAAGTMAHEVAHAWRAHQHLVVDSRDREELLTDVTTVYLGFGILTTNDTDRFRSSGDAREQRWSFSRYGYLPMQAMAYLLALQLAARNRDEELRAVAKQLEPNQKRAVQEALESFAERDVLEELSIPPRDSWPDPDRIPHTIAIREPDEEEALEAPAAPDPEHRNEGMPVHRLPTDASYAGFYVGLAFTLLLGVAGVAAIFSGDSMGGKAALVMAGMAAMIAIGFFPKRNKFVCSAADCRKVLPKDATTCPGCGGTIMTEELEADVSDTDYEECDDCRPEVPCERHAG